MISIGFFGCKRDQVVNCSWEEACDRFPLTGFTFPDASALASLSEVLTGSRLFSADPVPCSTEAFHELGGSLQAALRRATTEDLMDAGARWALLVPWKALDANPMDLAGFLLHLQSLVHGADREENAIFLLLESGSLPVS